MKFFAFCLVLCSIVLATLSPTKAYSADLKKEKQSLDIYHGKAVESVFFVNTELSPAMLPYRIQDHVMYVTYLRPENESGMEFENKIIKPKIRNEKEIKRNC